MSYGLRVTVKDGMPVVEKTTTEVPDGIWAINGHEDASYETLGCARASKLEGPPTLQANVSYLKLQGETQG